MNSPDPVHIVAGVMCLVLVVSALAARRLPLGDTLRMVGLWVLIFAFVSLAIWTFMAAA